jgi:hypothetical protein
MPSAPIVSPISSVIARRDKVSAPLAQNVRTWLLQGVAYSCATFPRPPEELAYTLRPRGAAWDAGPPPGSASFFQGDLR